MLMTFGRIMAHVYVLQDFFFDNSHVKMSFRKQLRLKFSRLIVHFLASWKSKLLYIKLSLHKFYVFHWSCSLKLLVSSGPFIYLLGQYSESDLNQVSVGPFLFIQQQEISGWLFIIEDLGRNVNEVFSKLQEAFTAVSN